MAQTRFGSVWSLVATGATIIAAPRVSSPAAETISIRVHEGTTLAFDLSPDGRTIVFDLLGQLWELPSAGGDARAVTNAVRDTAEDLDPSWSPDGRRIVFRGERRGRTGLWLLEPGSGAPRQLTQLKNPDGYEGNAAWSPDGKAILFARFLPPDSADKRWRSRLAQVDAVTGAVRDVAVADTVGRNLRDPAWEPGGRRFAVVAAAARSDRGGRIWMVETGSGSATPLTAESVQAVAPAFAPDGRRLAFFAPDSAQRIQVWVLRVDAPGIPVRLTSHADAVPSRVRWTPDGTQLVYSADGKLWKVPAEGGAPVNIPFSAALSFERPRRALPPARFPEPGVAQPVRAFMGLALSPDARSIAMLALGKLWVMPVDGTPRAVADVPLSARHPAWSPDGATLAWSAGPVMEADLFATDLGTGTTRRVTALPGREESPAYAPDGRHLAFRHSPTEAKTLLRIIDAGARDLSDSAQGQSLVAESGGDLTWTPAGDLMYVSGGFTPSRPTTASLVRLTGERREVTRMPDSPLFPRWAGDAIVFIRHARLWRAPFDSTGMRAAPEPLGAEPAMYSSVARDGTILFITEGGLHLRAPAGEERSLGWPLSYTPPVAGPTLIRNARIIDGTGKPATPPRDILIQGGRIKTIAAPGALEVGTAQVLDAEGRFVIPGLMDLHAHEYRLELLPGFAYFGVTTIRDQGSAIGPLIAYADAIAAGKLDGPRVGFGGFQFYSDWAYDAEDQQGVEPEADPGHVSRAVTMAHALGSQHIKTRTFRRWDINARMITEAHRLGMRATGHCAHPLPLVAAGMDAKEHGGFCAPRGDHYIYDDFVQLFHAADIGFIPTITYSTFAVRMNEHPEQLATDSELAPFVPARDNFGWMTGLDPAGRRMFAGFAESARQQAGRMARGGVTIGTGTDIWQIPTGAHMELEELVGAGLSPLEAIRAGTHGSAVILGADRDLGTIEPGKWADLIILDADPVADIRNSRRIRTVLEMGRVVDRAAILERFRGR